ncbi:MAG: helix-turn-helix transcriptional regulator [Oscillospiraceae bacterium]|nr:helix-turn-helix transcriptional regulator [Oscillospiraceae bacterium]
MILADKIIQLRKQNGWSQEELAEQLGVSRQAVSKWESAASVPDLNRILQMSELFGVSTDYLLKDGVETPSAPEMASDDGVLKITAEEANDFLNRSVRSAKQIALGVAVCILSPALLIWLAGFAGQENALSEEIAAGIGIVVLLLMVAAAVALFILSGFRMEEYKYITEGIIELAYGVEGIVQERKSRFRPSFRLSIVIGVLLCIFSPVPLIALSCLGASEMSVITCVVLLLIMVAAAVFLLVRAGMIQAGFDQLLQVGEYAVTEKKKKSSGVDLIESAYWCIVTAIYLLVSFWTGQWGVTWIIWVAAPGIYGIISALIERNKK